MRVLVVVAIVALCVVARWWYLGYRSRIEAHQPDHPPLPDRLRDPTAPRTWVVFTTPYCATCGPVTDKIAGADPDARVVTVDATREPALADAFSVRTAPTVLLADAAGQVSERFVGAEAVHRYFAAV